MQIVLSDIFSSSMNQIVPEPKISASNYNSTKKRASRASALRADGLHLRVDF